MLLSVIYGVRYSIKGLLKVDWQEVMGNEYSD